MDNNAVKALFKAIDNFDTQHVLSTLDDNAIFRFGNMPPVVGKENIKLFLEGFFSSIKAISHDALEIWNNQSVKLMNGKVTYTRHDGSTLTVFFANTFKMNHYKIKEYLIFVDTSALYS